MKLVHISDTHIVPAPSQLYGLDPRANLSAAIADIHANHADADLCVFTGDLVHWGDAEAYDALADVLAELKLPYVLMIGNHDDRARFQARFPDAPRDADGFVQGTLKTPMGTLVFLDTHDGTTHAGLYCETRRAWLARTLEGIEGDILLFAHHPPFPVGIGAMDAIALQEPDAFADVIRPHAQRIRHIFFGHLHRPISGSWLGIPFSVLRSQNHQVAMELRPTGRDVIGAWEQPAYAVALVTPEAVVVHMCEYLLGAGRFSLNADEGLGRAYALQMAGPQVALAAG
ncbi:3',5'-cyclic adenosine monophosphate phosphodiesterase CpdA [Azorhizobium oxalatiphilum]|uniref:3',5'-cyclic adenosine monophosphate phosphodiesterase CpdA n=1 Tax=Azorhizobium oxalatiphilum TaxID=980631 RepID=A0A917BQQ8_9HYPH|nr:phosphodiesterase [Azorhizobium oxalatiphilum]GGF55228.1 3',5'-cyclic adenosine monophosphate phosphodiesterase CpdA [Azorhizobium oxalatiphilum]